MENLEPPQTQIVQEALAIVEAEARRIEKTDRRFNRIKDFGHNILSYFAYMQPGMYGWAMPSPTYDPSHLQDFDRPDKPML